MLRVRLFWAGMYPLPRMIIFGALLIAITYGIVAFFVIVPLQIGIAAYLWVLAPLIVVLALAALIHGEPTDQTTIHSPHVKPPRMSEAEFDALEDRVDGLAAEPADDHPVGDLEPSGDAPGSVPGTSEAGFQALVRDAIDDLPAEYVHALEHVAVVVSDQGAVQRYNGRRQPLYGLYVGYGGRSSFLIGAPAGNLTPDRIVIFRDTLVQDFGDDPVRLRQQVTRTLRHELAHHLGWDEEGVRALGL